MLRLLSCDTVQRAGVLLIGVAAEITVRTAHDAMVASGFLTALNLQPGQPPSAKRLLDRALEEVAKKWPKQNEEQRNLKFDLMSLDSLREARNRAAIPSRLSFPPRKWNDILIFPPNRSLGSGRSSLSLRYGMGNFFLARGCGKLNNVPRVSREN